METIKKNGSKLVFVAVIALVCSWAIISNAGNLNPSAPPASTMHTLEEIYNAVVNLSADPRTPVQSLSGSSTALYIISQSGSYYLTGNINGVINKNGIEVTANNVTIDLSGYSMIGVGTTGTTGHAITGGSLITIENGSIRLWRQNGINVGAYSRLNGIIVSACEGTGISVGAQSVISNCTTYDNASDGFTLADASTMYACTANANGGDGIHSNGEAVVVEKCSAYNNSGDGMELSGDATVINCSSNENDRGFYGHSNCVFVNCIAGSNFGAGIRASNSKISNCTCNSDANGIEARGDCLVTDNVCSDNLTGISVWGSGNTIRGNSLTDNYTAGLNAPVHNYAAQNIFYDNTYANWTGAFTAGTGDMANIAIP